MTAQPVRVSYVTLLENSEEVQSHLKRAFGSEEGCLGIVVVQDLPEAFQALRIRLFYLAHALANQPEAVRESLSRPETKYSFGWSHGKEVMNGKPDTQKGSYYANPLLDVPVVSDQEKSNYPEYYAGNVWPQNIEGLEEFESTFKALGQIIFDVGCAIARACEPFVEISDSTRTSTVESLISSSKSNKARLLHYFAEPPKSDAERKETVANDALCGTHVDHSLLTGLCSAMYLSGDTAPQKVPPPSPTSGLYIYPRQSPAQTGRLPEALKVSIPEDCLAFQTGEALELLTGGKLAATPHFVSGSTGGSDTPVSRETFAFFLQPDVNDVIGPDGETFGGFTKRVLGRHYSEAVQEAED